MMKAFWFLIKLTALVALVVWLADRPGSVRLEWVDLSGDAFVINMHIGLFLAGLVGFVLLSIFIYQVIKTFVDLPKSLSRYNEIKAREKGYKSLTVGLSAVAAGDTKTAVLHAGKARKYLPDDTGLPLLLEAQAARLDGREGDAAKSFVALLEDKDAGFLGVRGLLQASLDAGDYDGALALAEKAVKSYPKQAWILKIAYDLQLRASRWEAARATLKALVKNGGISVEKARSDRAAILTAEAMEAESKGYDIYAEETLKKAMKAASNFVPAGLRLVDIYIQSKEPKKAIKLIEKAWKAQPHALYVPVWEMLVKDGEGADSLQRMRWLGRLEKINGASAELQLAVGRAAMGAGLWGEAREHLRLAESMEPSADIYKALAELEERTSKDEKAAKNWLSLAVSAPGAKSWVCSDTAMRVDEWRPFVSAQSGFNTLDYREPTGRAAPVILLDRASEIRDVIDAPKSKIA